MANNFDSNFTRQLARVFLEKFESARVLSKNVDTQLLAGKFNPASGANVDFKRPTDYTTSRNATGDATGIADDIITGKATGTVQDYFTTMVTFDEADEAIKMDQLDELLAPMATRIVTDLELDFAQFMMRNSGQLAGTFGTAVTTWSDVARAGAVLKSAGVPQDSEWIYAVNPYTEAILADVQRTLGAGGKAGDAVMSAHERATLTSNFAGMRVMSSTTLSSFTNIDTSGDLVGAMNGAPDVTYVTAKDTMTQTLAVTGFASVTTTVPAGTMIQVTGVNRLNMSTREPIVDNAGANVGFTAVLAEDASLSGGAGNFVITGPGIFESGGSYNTTDVAIGAANVVTILGADDTLYQPNLAWHRQAFSIGSVPIKKLFSTDTLATTEDGLQLRVSKFADGLTNVQSVRFDLRPAYAVLNPFFSAQAWG
jgi:hypothetical protein